MSEKIDYEAYLKQIDLADITTNQEDKIKQYLEEQCKTDDALKAVYNPEKIKDCYNFIFECAKKVAHGNSSVIEDAVVYKMARDYFIEILPNIINVIPVQEAVKEVSEQVETDVASDNVKRSECGFEIYGEDEESEEAEEETAEEPCDQEEVGEEEKVLQPVASDTLKYDEEGNGLLFDF